MTADLQALEALGKCIDVADGYARQERALPMVPATMEYQLGHIRDAYAKVHEVLTRSPAEGEALDMLLFCPACGKQHVDAPDGRTPDWKNPAHRSHLCHYCKAIWRQADVPTNGVAEIKTRGKADTWSRPYTERVASPAEGEGVVVPCVTDERVLRGARAIYALDPFYMPIGQRQDGMELCRAFDWEAAPAYRQIEAQKQARACLKAALTPAPQAEAEIGERPAAPATGDGLVARLKHLAHELDSQWITGSGRDLTLAADHIAALEKKLEEATTTASDINESLDDAGNQIARLQQSLSEKEKALREIRDIPERWQPADTAMRDIARSALGDRG